MDQSEHGIEVAQRVAAFLEAMGGDVKTSLRKRERSSYFRQIDLMLIGQVGQPKIFAYTRNLSLGGVGLLTRRAFKKGERFAAKFNLGEGLGKFVLCRVTFCRYVSDSMYEVGAEFEATAPCLNGNHHIPREWVTAAQGRGPGPVETSHRQTSAANSDAAKSGPQDSGASSSGDKHHELDHNRH